MLEVFESSTYGDGRGSKFDQLLSVGMPAPICFVKISRDRNM
jgi:hypothetical protein